MALAFALELSVKLRTVADALLKLYRGYSSELCPLLTGGMLCSICSCFARGTWLDLPLVCADVFFQACMRIFAPHTIRYFLDAVPFFFRVWSIRNYVERKLALIDFWSSAMEVLL